MALGLALFDNIADTAACTDSKAPAAACHTCSCGPHLAAPAVAEIIPAPAPAPYPAYEPPSYAILLSESFFRPPRLAA